MLFDLYIEGSMNNDYSIKMTLWSNLEDRLHLQNIRREVFIEEQQVPEQEEWDSLDEQAKHLLLIKQAEIIGCARILEQEGRLKLGRIAVLKPFRNQGAGQFLMQFVKQEAIEDNLHCIQLDAQTRVFDFYSKLGYQATSKPFDPCCDIPHITMQLPLQVQASQAQVDSTPSLFVVGEDSARYPMTDSMETQGYLELHLQQVRSHILIQWNTIDDPILCQPAWYENVLKLIKSSPKSFVRVLVPTLDTQTATPLLMLRERLSSRITFKLTDQLQKLDTFILFDQQGFLTVNSSQGWTSFADKARVKKLKESFDLNWEKARIPHENRRMYL